MPEEKKKVGCSTCETKAVLHVGDAICHRIQKSGGHVDCHGLVHQVHEKRMTLDQYVGELERKATPNEKKYVTRLRDVLEHGQ